ncbi:hypothetical protein BCR32DRAFT_284293 [Anaeromyces robustus]|uniref:Uncharacterized protein n=1 Tax=Anaeromyces robustus TaxID=1754192 RepID=A0A1Y1WSW4_9FUNG|nr:hypothetical protein BCR32DRAFT_284293 [Anaeromyces robustus]|eukprot:ORX76336.1 hypothetical protein BCR32DRAFT_284293 [Anaeromyces robustus]
MLAQGWNDQLSNSSGYSNIRPRANPVYRRNGNNQNYDTVSINSDDHINTYNE